MHLSGGGVPGGGGGPPGGGGSSGEGLGYVWEDKPAAPAKSGAGTLWFNLAYEKVSECLPLTACLPKADPTYKPGWRT